MDEQKQIEEMAFDLENHTCMSQFQAEIASRTLYILGYRRQSVGEWIFNKGRTYGEPAYYCSNCSEGASVYGFDKFCPNCGARMGGGE